LQITAPSLAVHSTVAAPLGEADADSIAAPCRLLRAGIEDAPV